MTVDTKSECMAKSSFSEELLIGIDKKNAGLFRKINRHGDTQQYIKDI
jgi:hypothetical protein